MTGTGTASQTVRVSARSKPSRVPSRSMLVSRISPAPSRAMRSHQATASIPVGRRPAVGEHLPAQDAVVPVLHLLRVDRDHDALRAEARRGTGDELGLEHRRGVDRHLVGARVQEPPNVADAAHAGRRR